MQTIQKQLFKTKQNKTIMEISKNLSYGPLTIDKISASEFQKAGTLTCQLRQIITVTSHYPSVRVTDGVNDSLFGASEFTSVKKNTYTNQETRVAFLIVPNTTTVQAVQMKLDALRAAGKNPCIQKVVANEPIVTEQQLYAVAKGLKSMDDFANAQVVRYGKNHALAGKIIKDDNGNPMYKRTFFKADKVEDVSNRNSTDVYISQEIDAEMNTAPVSENVLSSEYSDDVPF